MVDPVPTPCYESPVSNPFGDEKLDIEYPCPWPYTVIGEDEFAMRVAIGEVCDDSQHSIELSNRSRTGRYCSLKVEVIVRDDAQRTGLFHSLLRRDEIRYVI